MKTLFTLLFTLIAFTSFAQEVKQDLPVDESGKINFTEVIPVEATTKDELYTRARAWFATTFNSANRVLEMDDKESGVLIGKAFQDIYVSSLGIPVQTKLWYNVKVYLKDGRYKYELTELEYQGYPTTYVLSPPKAPAEMVIITMLNKPNGKPRPINQSYKDETVKAMTALAEHLKVGMAKSATSKTGDDW